MAKNGERKNCEPLLTTIIGIINTIMDFTGRINANVVTYLWKHLFSCGHATLKEALSVRPSVRPSVHPSVRWSVMIESKSVKTRISAPAHPSATGGRVSGLVYDYII